MKKTKTIALAAALVVAMSAPAFASGNTPSKTSQPAKTSLPSKTVTANGSGKVSSSPVSVTPKEKTTKPLHAHVVHKTHPKTTVSSKTMTNSKVVKQTP